jgi:hypothetical protein
MIGKPSPVIMDEVHLHLLSKPSVRVYPHVGQERLAEVEPPVAPPDGS